MSVDVLLNERKAQSATVLANGAELVSGIIKEIAGNDISTSINGNTATNQVIQTIALQRISKKLEEKRKNLR
ncbi:MAG: hypothetical protein M0Q87_14685 [Ottowia sp.]|nr:hypothetical protein [Ottowia sp.]